MDEWLVNMICTSSVCMHAQLNSNTGNYRSARIEIISIANKPSFVCPISKWTACISRSAIFFRRPKRKQVAVPRNALYRFQTRIHSHFRSAGAASPFTSRPNSLSPLGFNMHPDEPLANDSGPSCSVNGLSSSSSEVQIKIDQHTVKTGEETQPVGSTSRLYRFKKDFTFENATMSQSPPPLAIDIEWSALVSPQSAAVQQRRHAGKTESPPPPPPPLYPNVSLSLQDAATMMRIVEMHKLFSAADDDFNQKHGSSAHTLAASLRKLRVDWMLGQWIEGITQASLAFNLWRQRSLFRRAAGEIPCARQCVFLCSIVKTTRSFDSF